MPKKKVKPRYGAMQAVMDKCDEWIARCVYESSHCLKCGSKLPMRHGDCPICPKRKEKPVKLQIVTLGSFPSSSQKEVTHYVSLDRSKSPPYLSCSCPGFVYNHKCWHLEEVRNPKPVRRKK